MKKLISLWRQVLSGLASVKGAFTEPSSSRYHVKEWHRRQREALRQAQEAQMGNKLPE